MIIIITIIITVIITIIICIVSIRMIMKIIKIMKFTILITWNDSYWKKYDDSARMLKMEIETEIEIKRQKNR